MNNFESIQKVCEEFDLGVLKTSEQIEEGVLNVNYKIETDKGKFFIKTVRGKKQDSLETIYKTEKYVKSFDLPVATMLLTKDNNYFLKIEEQSFCAYPFIESDRSHEYSEQDYFRMGEMLAKIHLLSKDNLPNFEVRPIKNPSTEKILLILESFKQKIDSKEILDVMDKKFLANINLKIQTLKMLSENENVYSHKNHLLHGDYQTGNLLIDKDSREIIGICDWEKSEVGSRAYEIARSLLCIVDFRNEEDFKNIKFFIDGYNSKYPISEQELIEGFEYRLNRTVKSKWIETMYYENNDSRANHFVDYERFLIEFSATDWKNKIKEYIISK
jgi:Ser/Thr protein kinase RdoA (MazF antagonist)